MKTYLGHFIFLFLVSRQAYVEYNELHTVMQYVVLTTRKDTWVCNLNKGICVPKVLYNQHFPAVPKSHSFELDMEEQVHVKAQLVCLANPQ
jgi:hypothetical protein